MGAGAACPLFDGIKHSCACLQTLTEGLALHAVEQQHDCNMLTGTDRGVCQVCKRCKGLEER